MNLEPGTEATVLLPPAKSKGVRLRLWRIEPNGDLTFVHPKTGGLRTVRPEAVKRVHRKKVLRNE